MLTDAEFDDLSVKELAALRGDSLEVETDEGTEVEEEKEVEDEEETESSEEDEEETESSEEDEEEGSEEAENEESEDPEPEPDEQPTNAPENDLAKERLELEQDKVKLLQEQIDVLKDAQKANVPEKDPVPEYDFAASEKKYIDLILEGEVESASALRAEISSNTLSTLRDELRESESKASDIATEAVQENAFQKVVLDYEAQYKFLDTESTDYNEDAVDTINAIMSSHMDKGVLKAEALKLAIDRVIPLYTKEVEEPVPTKKRKSPREVEAANKAVKASQAQPNKSTPSISENETDLSSLDITKMSESEFNKLSAKELAILRGDVAA